MLSFPDATAQRELEQLMLAFDSNLAPVVGQQITATPGDLGSTSTRIDLLEARAAATDPSKLTVVGGSAPVVSISAAPAAIASGQASTLTWTSTGATSCTASGAWSETRTVSGSESVRPTAAGASTYTLTCTGAAGSGASSATITVSVPVPVPTVTLAASPGSVMPVPMLASAGQCSSPTKLMISWLTTSWRPERKSCRITSRENSERPVSQ